MDGLTVNSVPQESILRTISKFTELTRIKIIFEVKKYVNLRNRKRSNHPRKKIAIALISGKFLLDNSPRFRGMLYLKSTHKICSQSIPDLVTYHIPSPEVISAKHLVKV